MENNIRRKERQLIISFLFFPLLLLVAFNLWPMLALVSYSFTSWDGLSPKKEFIGFANYVRILKDPDYIRVFLNSFIYFAAGLIQIVIALSFAIMLSYKVRGKTFFKAAIVFPTVISGMAIGMMFKVVLTPKGSLDMLLAYLGLGEHTRYWLGDPRVVNYTLGAISVWRHTGRSFILYFGAITCIPKEHYKQAAIEGASIWQTIRYVILPGIHIVLKLNFILLTIGALSAFEIPMIMTNGSNGTSTFLLKTMKTAFEDKMYGRAASMAMIIGVIIIALTSLQQKVKTQDHD